MRLAVTWSLLLYQFLGYLHRIQRGTLAQVVRHDPHIDAVRDRLVFPDPADVDIVLACHIDRQRIEVFLRIIVHHDAGAPASTARTSLAEMFFSVSMFTDSSGSGRPAPVRRGRHRMESSSRIFLVSFTIFISSLV